MIRAGSGFGGHRDPVEAAIMARAGVGLDHADACVVFATGDASAGTA